MNTVIERTGFDPAQDADNGNRFLTGNGYLGVRGTISEAGVQQMTAVNLAGIHHQKGQGWEEPLNAPNPLYVAVKGVSLPENADRLTSHRLALDIADGEFLCILGGNGSGKSTLAKHLNALLTPDSGSVEVDGLNTSDPQLVYDVRSRVGMVFQKPNPFPMSVYDNIAYGPRTHGVKKKAELDEIVEKSLRDAAIWDEVKDRLNKSALGMSGGQQQRLCIARALAVEPEVLLMDEPTSALDPISTSKVEELATELKENYTIVMVTHNMQQAARISDKTAFFLLGELVEMGPTERVFATPVDKRTEDYISGRFG